MDYSKMLDFLKLRKNIILLLFLQFVVFRLFAPIAPIWPWFYLGEQATKSEKIKHFSCVAQGLLNHFSQERPVVIVDIQNRILEKGRYFLTSLYLENRFFVTKILTEWKENGLGETHMHCAKYFWLNDGRILQVLSDMEGFCYKEVLEDDIIIESKFFEILIPFVGDNKFLFLDIVSENIYALNELKIPGKLNFLMTNLEVDMRRFSSENVAD